MRTEHGCRSRDDCRPPVAIKLRVRLCLLRGDCSGRKDLLLGKPHRLPGIAIRAGQRELLAFAVKAGPMRYRRREQWHMQKQRGLRIVGERGPEFADWILVELNGDRRGAGWKSIAACCQRCSRDRHCLEEQNKHRSEHKDGHGLQGLAPVVLMEERAGQHRREDDNLQGMSIPGARSLKRGASNENTSMKTT